MAAADRTALPPHILPPDPVHPDAEPNAFTCPADGMPAAVMHATGAQNVRLEPVPDFSPTEAELGEYTGTGRRGHRNELERRQRLGPQASEGGVGVTSTASTVAPSLPSIS